MKKIDWSKIKLTPEEQEIEDNAELSKPVSRAEFLKIKEAIDQHNKSSVLNMRVNPDDILRIKEKAKKFGVKYQTFIAAILHRVARS